MLECCSNLVSNRYAAFVAFVDMIFASVSSGSSLCTRINPLDYLIDAESSFCIVEPGVMSLS